MVAQPIIAGGIKHPRIIRAMRTIPRHPAIPPDPIKRAYNDRAVPIGDKQSLSQSHMAPQLTYGSRLTERKRVLEGGIRSGYKAAWLADLCFNAFSVTRLRAFTRKARGLLARLQCHDITVHVGDGTIGRSEHAPYHGMMFATAAFDLPDSLLDPLPVRGRLVMPAGDDESRLGDRRLVKLRGRYGWPD